MKSFLVAFDKSSLDITISTSFQLGDMAATEALIVEAILETTKTVLCHGIPGYFPDGADPGGAANTDAAHAAAERERAWSRWGAGVKLHALQPASVLRGGTPSHPASGSPSAFTSTHVQCSQYGSK